MELGLEGKAAIVTGGSRGIGRATALALAAEGCHIAICARAAEALQNTAGELCERGVKVHAEVCDVSDPAALDAFLEGARAALGGSGKTKLQFLNLRQVGQYFSTGFSFIPSGDWSS